MQIRLWFWTAENPRPRVIAHGNGGTVLRAMVACFAPVNEPGWKYEEDEHGDGYLRRGRLAGYCGQEVMEGELIRSPRSGLSRKRESL